MALIRSLGDISKKWSTVTPARQTEYQGGVSNPLRDWEKNTTAAADRYNTGVQQAVTRGSFAKGVSNAGNEKWSRKATQIGPRRWAEGVSVASPEYESGFAAYRDTIEKTALPPRFSRGDPRNWERSKAIGLALNQVRTGAK